MAYSKVRTRFAPSPSGMMHIGNLRSALISYICAKENEGTFILRIEDTDTTRTISSLIQKIYKNLEVIGIYPDEDYIQGGPYAPYIQSERSAIYKKYIELLHKKNLIYRCFQTKEELEKIKNEQRNLKLPPRYKRKHISKETENEYLSKKIPFIWRFALPATGNTKITDKVKKEINFDLSHFADFPLTRGDGSYTFLFTNFVDDVEMKISYVIRGQEHISNSALQSYMYDSLSLFKPLFYHLPLLCDSNGKKLSKRDSSFNIEDLLEEGFLPSAIINYLGIIGNSLNDEILSLQEMIEKKVFEKTEASGTITYDMNKLIWINTKWMTKLEYESFLNYINQYKKIHQLKTKISNNEGFINALRSELKTVKELFSILDSFYNTTTEVCIPSLYKIHIITLKEIISQNKEEIIVSLNNYCNAKKLKKKELYKVIRKIILYQEKGISISLLLQYIEKELLLKKINNVMYQ